MTIKVAINGFGRIGRCVLRAAMEEGFDDIEIIAINGPAPTETHAHLLQYDSVHGRLKRAVSHAGDTLTIEGLKPIRITHARDVAELDWSGIDVVLECTGALTDSAKAAAHLQQGARKVLISAPASDDCRTIVYGVNNAALQKGDDVVSVGSCTTNCLAPVAKVLHETFGIEAGYMTTIHAYTSDQNLQDGSHKDLRRARAAALSMIPTKTGAAKALGLVLPELQGKLDGTSIRVPVANVSMVDLTFTSVKPVSKDAINTALRNASQGTMKGVLAVSDAPLVSCDYLQTSASANADLTGTQVVGDRFARVAAWYDNEWGFSCRMLDVARLIIA